MKTPKRYYKSKDSSFVREHTFFFASLPVVAHSLNSLQCNFTNTSVCWVDVEVDKMR